MSRRKYTNDFKQEAVRLVQEQGLKASEVARDLGVKETTLYNWVSQAKRGLFNPCSPESLESEELKRLRKENSVLKREREILKKATAFFAKISD